MSRLHRGWTSLPRVTIQMTGGLGTDTLTVRHGLPSRTRAGGVAMGTSQSWVVVGLDNGASTNNATVLDRGLFLSIGWWRTRR